MNDLKPENCPIGKELNGKIKVLESQQAFFRDESEKGDKIIASQIIEVKTFFKELSNSIQGFTICITNTKKDIESIGKEVKEVKNDHEHRLRDIEKRKGRWLDRIVSGGFAAIAAVSLSFLIAILTGSIKL